MLCELFAVLGMPPEPGIMMLNSSFRLKASSKRGFSFKGALARDTQTCYNPLLQHQF